LPARPPRRFAVAVTRRSRGRARDHARSAERGLCQPSPGVVL